MDLPGPNLREEAESRAAATDAPLVPARRAVVVAGMHRSGTSALARLLSLIGADLPRVAGEPQSDHLAAFWEPLEIVQLHEELLAVLGSSWDDVACLPRRWFDSPQSHVFVQRLGELVASNFGDSPLFVLKDPRICRLIPVWLPIFEDLGLKPGFVLPIRNPLEVADSLRERNGFSLAKSLLLWLRHILDSERDTRGLPRSFVSYERLLRDWPGEIERVSNELDLAWPRFSDRSRVEIEAFLSTGLRHHRFALEDVEVRPDVAEWIRSTYSAVLAATRKSDCREVLDDVGKKVQEADAVFGPLLAEWASHGRAASELREKLEEGERVLTARDEEIRGLRTQLEAVAESATELSIALSAARSDVEGLQQQLSARTSELGDVQAEVEKLRAQSRALGEQLEERSAERAQLAEEIGRLNEIRIAEDARLEREARRFETEIERLTRAHDGEIASLTTELQRLSEARERETARLEAEVERLTRAREGEIARLATELRRLSEARDREITQLETELQRLTAVHEVDSAQLHAEVKRLRDELARMLETNTWQARARRLAGFFSRRFHYTSQFLSWILRHPSRKRLRWVLEYFALRRSDAFNAGFYRDAYPDVVRAGLSPLMHYIEHGAYEGRDPSPGFSTLGYVTAHSEIARTGVNPLLHYVRARRKATRKTRAESGATDDNGSSNSTREAAPGSGPQRSHTAHAVGERIEKERRSTAASDRSFSVVFLLPTEGSGGGAHSVVQEALGMRDLGVNAKVAIEERNRQQFFDDYPALAEPSDLFYVYGSPEDVIEYAGGFDCVVATIFHSMTLAQMIVDKHPGVVPAYYVQDYEPWFFKERSHYWKVAAASYTLVTGATLFAKTDWLCGTVRERHGVDVEKVSPSLDHSVFSPSSKRRPETPVRVTAMVRPSSVHRGAARTMRVLKRLKERFGSGVEISIFGCASHELGAHNIEHAFQFANESMLIREQVAELFRRTDVFLDLSDWQAFGRSGLEAMACDCATVLPIRGGVTEYAVDRENALLVDTSQEERCYLAACELISDAPLRRRLGAAGVETASDYSIRWAAISELVVLERAVAKRRAIEVAVDLHATRRRQGDETELVPVDPVEPPPLLQQHLASVDIVVCVHNALTDVRRCLDSVVEHSTLPYSLVLVDDGSNDETQDYLTAFARAHRAKLIRNDLTRGYTLGANQGLGVSRGDYVVLLNSDTIVTPYWLDRLVQCAESSPLVGLVGPLSNAATWQSVPEIICEGRWAQNDLPEGFDAAKMAMLVERYSARVYPRIPFLNGFCLLIRRQVIEQVGVFDEETFGRGYGEENDYCIRARSAGWELAVADDAYVHHARRRSYAKRAAKLSESAHTALIEKHGQDLVEAGTRVCRFDRVLEGIRARARVMPERERLLEAGRARWGGKLVAFVLPVSRAGGGASIVMHEANAMASMGVGVNLVNFAFNRDGFERSYPDNRLPSVYAREMRELPELLGQYDAVLATWCESVGWLDSLPVKNGAPPIRAYYIQDFEPYFFDPGSDGFRMAWESYTRYPDLVRIAKTDWTRHEVKRQIGVDCFVGGPTVDIDLFRPRQHRANQWPERPLRILGMIRPSTPRRAARLTMEVLRDVQWSFGNTVEIILFGCDTRDPQFQELPLDFQWRNAGIVNRMQVASLMDDVDVFVDFSEFQAQGLTAMEAMACGAAVVVPQRGGSVSFVQHEVNGLVVDTRSRDACLTAVERLVNEHDLRLSLRRRAIWDICDFFAEAGAFRTLETVFEASQNGGARQEDSEAQSRSSEGRLALP